LIVLRKHRALFISQPRCATHTMFHTLNESQINKRPALARLLASGWVLEEETKKPPPPPPLPAPVAALPPPVASLPQPPTHKWKPRPCPDPLILVPDAEVREVPSPLVSVIMPAWNAAKYIRRAVHSMQAQLLKDWELCICDDGSDDKTYATATRASKGDDRVKVSRIPHGGYAVATDVCLAMSTGQIIARLDADDEQHPERLQAQADWLIRHPEVDCVTCDMTDLVKKGQRWVFGQVLASEPMDAERYVQGWGGPCHASVVAWRRAYDQIGGFHPTEEWDGDGGWNLRAIRLGLQWGHISSPWYYHRRYPAMRSERFRAEQDGMHRDLLARFQQQEAAAC